MPRQIPPHKALDAYYRPEHSHEHETRQVGCKAYRADIVNHTSEYPLVKYYILFAGRNLKKVVTIETAHNAAEVDQKIKDFAIGVHKDRRCRCSWTSDNAM